MAGIHRRAQITAHATRSRSHGPVPVASAPLHPRNRPVIPRIPVTGCTRARMGTAPSGRGGFHAPSSRQTGEPSSSQDPAASSAPTGPPLRCRLPGPRHPIRPWPPSSAVPRGGRPCPRRPRASARPASHGTAVLAPARFPLTRLAGRKCRTKEKRRHGPQERRVIVSRRTNKPCLTWKNSRVIHRR
jgi:hypothetical protein